MLRRAMKLAVAIFLAVTLIPGPGSAEEPPNEFGPITCAAPTPGVPGTPAEQDALRDQFVALWTPRVIDDAFMQNYADQATVPTGILAEGFHDENAETQGWLIACLVDNVVAIHGVDGNRPGAVPSDQRLQEIRAGMGLVIFNKPEIEQLRNEASQPDPVTDPSPSPTQNAVTAATNALSGLPVVLPPDQSGLVPDPPDLTPLTDLLSTTNDTLQNLIGSNPIPNPLDPLSGALDNIPTANPLPSLDPGLLPGGVNPPGLPTPDDLRQLIDSLLQSVTNLPSTLPAFPPAGLVGGVTYKVCSESASVSLRCTIALPVGVPIPVDVTNDLIPDFLAHLTPSFDAFAPFDASFSFNLTRLPTAPAGPIPAHVFAVYDPPTTGKRIEFGYDGRPSTLANQTNSTATLKNAVLAAQGDLQKDLNLRFRLTHQSPGSVEAVTAAVKTLVSQGVAQPPTEADPLAGAIRFEPVPESLTADLRLQRQPVQDQSTLQLTSSVATRVDALVTRDINTTSPNSHQELQGVIDKLPTSATIDLVRSGDVSTLHYFADAVIDHVSVSEKLVPDTSQPGTSVETVGDLLGVPDDVTLTLTGGSDVLYAASSPLTQASAKRAAFTDSQVQSSVAAVAKQVPTNMHINVANGGDPTKVTYDADASLGEVSLSMFDAANDRTSLTAKAVSLPTHAELTAAKSNGVVDYTANSPIATIEATLTRAGGSTLPLAGDHATVLKQANKLGVDLKLSGLQAAHMDPSEKANYSMTLSPGGQAFKAIADLDDPNVLATLDVSNLPSTIDVTLDPANGAATYQASNVINGVQALFNQRDTGMLGKVELESIPQTINIGFATGGATPEVTYEASDRLGKLHALYVESPGGTSFDGLVEDLPPFFRVQGQDPFSFDARSGPGADPASSYLGKVRFRYASDGTFAVAPTADDHALLQVSPASTHAELLYSGLELVSFNTANRELHVDLSNTAKRLFRTFVNTPNLALEGFIDGVPDTVKVDVVGQTATYQATSPVDQIAAEIDRLNGEKFAVDVQDIPATINLTFDSVNSAVNWTASAPVTSVAALATFGPPSTGSSRTFDASLVLTGIPAIWKASYAAGHPRFEGVSGPIGSISAKFTNHGTTTTLAGDHLSAVFDSASGDVDASLRVSKLSLADYQPVSNAFVTGFTGDLNMGDGSQFRLNAQATLPDARVSVTGTISDLPTAMHVESINGVMRYTGNSNPDIQLSASYGTAAALGATPNPPSLHGLAVRDGQSCSLFGCKKAVKANLYLTGFPRQLDFNPPAGTYTVTNFKPTVNPLSIDARLTAFVPTPASLLVTQAGIPSGVNFTYGPTTTTTLGNGTVQTHLGYTASAPLGKLTADATIGNDEAYFEASSVPSSLSVDTSFGAATKVITVTMGTAVTDIKAMYKHAGDATFAAGAHLHDVPKTVNLTLGKEDDGQGMATPVFTYSGDTAGLDITAFANASLFGGDITAQADLEVTDFGKVVTADLVDTTLTLKSSPPTGSFNLLASGRIVHDVDLGFNAGPLENTGNLTLTLDIFRLNIAFTDLTELTLMGGITSAILGDYGTFTFGERSNLNVTISDRLVVDTGVGDVEIFDFGPVSHDLGDVVGNFRLATNHLDSWFTLPTPIPCGGSFIPPDVDFFHISVDLKPHPHSTTAGPSFTVSPPGGGEGNAHLITVNPFGILPDFVMDIIARFTTPLDNGDQGLSLKCVD